MVIFHKYDIRIKPGTSPALTLYVPTQEDLEKSEEYMRLVAEKRPCRFQLTDTQIWYRNGENNRQATEEEISGWTQNNEYIRMPQMEIHSPMISYVLDVICECVLAPEMVKKRLDDFRKYQKSHDTEYRNRLNSLLTEKRTLEIEKENLLRAVERGIATEEILSRIVKKQSDIERVIVSIEELENNKPKEIDEVEFKKLIRKTKQLIKAKKPEELRRFISFYVPKIEIGKDDIKVVLSFRNIVLLLGRVA